VQGGFVQRQTVHGGPQVQDVAETAPVGVALAIKSSFSRTSDASRPPPFQGRGGGIGNETNPPLPTFQPTTQPHVWVSPVLSFFRSRAAERSVPPSGVMASARTAPACLARVARGEKGLHAPLGPKRFLNFFGRIGWGIRSLISHYLLKAEARR
jgi:hypothetical protein